MVKRDSCGCRYEERFDRNRFLELEKGSDRSSVIRYLKEVCLEGADLSHLDLHDADLQGKSLAWANLTHANLAHANLSNAMLRTATLNEAVLEGADLTNANMIGCAAIKACFDHARMDRVDLKRGLLDQARLCHVQATQANFKNARLHHSNFSGSNFSKSDFSYANLLCADLKNAEFEDVCFTGTHMEEVTGKCNFHRANFYRTILAWAQLKGSNFHGAILKYTVLVNADLSECKMTNAYIESTNMSYASLHAADLRFSTLIRVNLHGAELDNSKNCLIQHEQSDIKEENNMTAKFYVNGRYFFTKNKVKRPFKGEKVLIDEEKYEVFEVTHDFDHGIFLIDLIKEETEAPEEEEGEAFTSVFTLVVGNEAYRKLLKAEVIRFQTPENWVIFSVDHNKAIAKRKSSHFTKAEYDAAYCVDTDEDGLAFVSCCTKIKIKTKSPNGSEEYFSLSVYE